ncbi:hypothetical protein GYMLUDRAFT_176609 [Collybiopsis luxurians FD-317 M1]|uniref:Uncharacterized protein n=1 Tax=Collybiopsis luxurians FD-317 M1 TaxID=944289 RepID=A0A0D0BJ58_9AGAR|nr:hypothetical protein GYMLUDRAFT_176609 [Collybiopsis luxurians FD-317 M1]
MKQPIQSETETSVPPNYYHPLETHPLYHSHVFHCVKDCTNIVVNLSGSSLPKCNENEKESYSKCMLTLFKPWHLGLHLKNIEESWEATFASHIFTPRQSEIMCNMETKHQC